MSSIPCSARVQETIFIESLCQKEINDILRRQAVIRYSKTHQHGIAFVKGGDRKLGASQWWITPH